MLNIETVGPEKIEEGKELGYIVDAATYENEEAAEAEGFYWYDEIEAWVNVEKFERFI